MMRKQKFLKQNKRNIRMIAFIMIAFILTMLKVNVKGIVNAKIIVVTFLQS